MLDIKETDLFLRVQITFKNGRKLKADYLCISKNEKGIAEEFSNILEKQRLMLYDIKTYLPILINTFDIQSVAVVKTSV